MSDFAGDDQPVGRPRSEASINKAIINEFFGKEEAKDQREKRKEMPIQEVLSLLKQNQQPPMELRASASPEIAGNRKKAPSWTTKLRFSTSKTILNDGNKSNLTPHYSNNMRKGLYTPSSILQLPSFGQSGPKFTFSSSSDSDEEINEPEGLINSEGLLEDNIKNFQVDFWVSGGGDRLVTDVEATKKNMKRITEFSEGSSFGQEDAECLENLHFPSMITDQPIEGLKYSQIHQAAGKSVQDQKTLAFGGGPDTSQIITAFGDGLRLGSMKETVRRFQSDICSKCNSKSGNALPSFF